jgi:hypothetical protein
MTVQFTPPPDWLVQNYINRKSPVQEILDAGAGAANSYVAAKSAKQKVQNDALKQYVDAFGVGGPALAGQVAQRNGLQNPPVLPSSSTAPGDAYAPKGVTPAPLVGKSPDETASPDQAPPVSPIIQASLAAGHPNHAGLSYTPPTPEQMASYQNQGKYGQGKIAEANQALGMTKTQLEINKLQNEDPNVPVMTREDALKKGVVDKNAKIIEPLNTDAKDSRYTNEQDRLEQQAIDRLSKLRGDQSLARVENQRDASIQAYNTIERIKQEGRDPSKLEYTDLLGQMWKARTGSSPTDQALRDLDQKTAHGDIGKAYTYFAGKPGGATTPEVLQNIQDFIADSGTQADKLHSSYMDSHKLKPSGLEDARWQPVLNSHRGMSFVEGTGYKPKSSAASGGWSYVGKAQ